MSQCIMCHPGDYSEVPLDDIAFCSRHALQIVNEVAAEQAAERARLRAEKVAQ